MTAAFALLFALATPGPTLPAGSSAAFQSTAFALQERLREGQFDEAKAMLGLLPQRRVTVTWDDSAVPAEQRAAVADARDRAFQTWRTEASGVEFDLVPDGRVKISFVDRLPVSPDTGLPAGAVTIVSDDPADPRIETVIALNRFDPPDPVRPAEVTNEVAFAIGSYLGLAQQPRPTSVMGRRDDSWRSPPTVAPDEKRALRRIFEVVEILQTAVERRTKLEPAKPEGFVTPGRFDPDPVLQGQQIQFSFEVQNRGNVPLEFRVVPDCACFSLNYTPIIEAGASGLVQVNVDTTVFPGPFDKALYVYSNDPEMPIRRFPVKTFVRPVFRILRASGDQPLVVGETGGKETVYLLTDPERTLKVTQIESVGMSAVIDWAPWEGEIADPEYGEPARKRTGYKVDVLIAPNVPNGRNPLGLEFRTDDVQFGTIPFSFMVQKGVVALPTTVFFGEISNEPAKAWFLVSRPGKAFRVTKVESDNEYVTATAAAPRPNGDIRIDVVFKGGAPFGTLDARVTVHTDDPAQPRIVVPVQGTLR